jgi:hypothetical protein
MDRSATVTRVSGQRIYDPLPVLGQARRVVSGLQVHESEKGNR